MRVMGGLQDGPEKDRLQFHVQVSDKQEEFTYADIKKLIRMGYKVKDKKIMAKEKDPQMEKIDKLIRGLELATHTRIGIPMLTNTGQANAQTPNYAPPRQTPGGLARAHPSGAVNHSNITCRNCLEMGHFASNCPKPQVSQEQQEAN